MRALWIISHEKGENASIRFSRYVSKLNHSACFILLLRDNSF